MSRFKTIRPSRDITAISSNPTAVTVLGSIVVKLDSTLESEVGVKTIQSDEEAVQILPVQRDS